jgi:hypothetical protein
MRKLALPVTAALVALFSGSATAADMAVLRGKVLNDTCYGPCVVDQQYPPYTGEGLRVGIREARSGNLVKVLHPTDGTFRASVPRGRYLVRASVVGQEGPGNYNCWQGDSQTVRVPAGKTTAVELTVTNTCIV